VLTLLPSVTVGLATNGAGAAGAAALDPSLSPSASVPTLEAVVGTGILAVLTPEMLDMGWTFMKLVGTFSFDTFPAD
jgi:hypothetical protein